MDRYDKEASIVIGTQLGSFEITAKIGEGGMGEVYRATDSKLKREVAIKVLPTAFTEDPERLARFEREAQLLAQLQHPNIASIYGLEDSDGARALVLELVEGPTLAERLERGALTLEECLAIARQVAEALEEAHEKGIIHRDLKPQNIKASVDGKVKVLDFGLAKAMDPTLGSTSVEDLARSPTLLNSPTLTAVHGTQLGVILGTAAYMAPEQARGGVVDKRADIWAFGVLLYEMLVGKALFSADTVTDTLAGVLKTEIEFTRLPSGVPPAIRRLLRRCLDRNPKNRLHDIADARISLDEVLRGDNEEDRDVPAALEPARHSSWRLPVAFAATAAVALAAGWLLRSPPSAAPTGLRVELAIPTGYEIAADQYPGVSLSASGRRQIVTLEDDSGQTRLLLRDLDEVEPRFLPGTDGAVSPILSPDGEWLAFVLDGGLRKISIAGGPSTQLGDATTGGDFRGGTWSSDGFLYFSPGTNNGLSRISENGGAVTGVTELDAARRERTHRWPDALPDGSAVLFTSDTSESSEYYDDARIEAVRPATGERKVVLEESSQARFLAPNHLLFARGGTLFVVRFDAEKLETIGTPIPLVQGVSTTVASGAARFATAASGIVIWIPGEATTPDRRLVWLGADGMQEPLDLAADRYAQIALSPDGRRLAVTLDGSASTDLWVVDLDRGTKSRLTFSGSPTDLIWSPDGNRVFYGMSFDGGGIDIFSNLADGSGEPERLVHLEGDEYPGSFTPDGGTLVIESNSSDRGDSDLLGLDLASGETRSLFAGPHNEVLAAISPDGRFIAYSSSESGGRNQIVVHRYPELTGKWQISLDGGFEPNWSPEGDALYFRAGGSLHRVAVDTRNGFHAGAPEKIADTMQRGSLNNTYEVAHEGRVLLVRRATRSLPPDRVALDLDLAERARRLLEPKP